MADAKEKTNLLRKTDVMRITRLSQATVWRMFHRADFPALKVGGRLMVVEAAFYAWLDKQRIGGAENDG